jgi:hypothetical protein
MKNTSPVKNTDPKKLDRSNEGDAAVLTLADGGTVSCRLTDVMSDRARFEWRTGPAKHNIRWEYVPRAQWLDRVTLFPAGCMFLAV